MSRLAKRLTKRCKKGQKRGSIKKVSKLKKSHRRTRRDRRKSTHQKPRGIMDSPKQNSSSSLMELWQNLKKPNSVGIDPTVLHSDFKDQIYNIVNSAIEYGYANGIIRKKGNTFVLTKDWRDPKIANRRPTPVPDCMDDQDMSCSCDRSKANGRRKHCRCSLCRKRKSGIARVLYQSSTTFPSSSTPQLLKKKKKENECYCDSCKKIKKHGAV